MKTRIIPDETHPEMCRVRWRGQGAGGGTVCSVGTGRRSRERQRSWGTRLSPEDILATTRMAPKLIRPVTLSEANQLGLSGKKGSGGPGWKTTYQMAASQRATAMAMTTQTNTRSRVLIRSG